MSPRSAPPSRTSNYPNLLQVQPLLNGCSDWLATCCPPLLRSTPLSLVFPVHDLYETLLKGFMGLAGCVLSPWGLTTLHPRFEASLKFFLSSGSFSYLSFYLRSDCHQFIFSLQRLFEALVPGFPLFFDQPPSMVELSRQISPPFIAPGSVHSFVFRAARALKLRVLPNGELLPVRHHF